ncbi:hypothetical protein THAOC_11500, partial [Thalassiosira oceanica]
HRRPPAAPRGTRPSPPERRPAVPPEVPGVPPRRAGQVLVQAHEGLPPEDLLGRLDVPCRDRLALPLPGQGSGHPVLGHEVARRECRRGRGELVPRRHAPPTHGAQVPEHGQLALGRVTDDDEEASPVPRREEAQGLIEQGGDDQVRHAGSRQAQVGRPPDPVGGEQVDVEVLPPQDGHDLEPRVALPVLQAAPLRGHDEVEALPHHVLQRGPPA